MAENKRGIEADLEAGKTYYIITQVKMGGWRARMAFIPVTMGSEFWDTVETYKQNLNFIEANSEMIATWEAKEKTEAQQIINYLNSPEGQKYVVKLNMEDGR
jgi:ABC-type glycerol-3-phosphate transport system substrate-binding protein